MSHIEVRRSHGLGREAARRAAEDIARRLDEEFDLSYRWEEDVLHFQRRGVDGHMQVSESEIYLCCRLALVLRPLRARLQGEIERYLDSCLS